MDKNQETINNIQLGIDRIKNKEHKIVFYVQDTKGNAKASVATIYQHAKTLSDLGYKTIMLHEKEDYMMVGSWLGSEYDELEHHSIEKNEIKISPSDFLVVPEIYGNVIESVAKLPMEKIVLVQQFEHMLDSYAPGKSWLSFGTHETITTSDILKTLIEDTLRIKNVSVIPIGIEDYFVPISIPKKPVIALHCRDTKKAAKIIKQFYLKYPILKFITFKDMHNMTMRDFAHNLKECAVAVWLDDISSFGTFPLEAIKCNVPVIGKAPSIIPAWMSDDNGIWVYDDNQIVDMIYNFMKSWLEDTLPEQYNNVAATIEGKFEMSELKKAVEEVYTSQFEKRVAKLETLKEKYVSLPEEITQPNAE